jgi:hypothetical protein
VWNRPKSCQTSVEVIQRLLTDSTQKVVREILARALKHTTKDLPGVSTDHSP